MRAASTFRVAVRLENVQRFRAMAEEVLLLVSTFPNVEEARRIGRLLVEERLAACVNLLPAAESIYRWQDAVETSVEVLALLKTTIGRYSALAARFQELHPYEVPELLAFRPVDGLQNYLRWVDESCS